MREFVALVVAIAGLALAAYGAEGPPILVPVGLACLILAVVILIWPRVR